MAHVQGGHDGNAFQADHIGIADFTQLFVQIAGGGEQVVLLTGRAGDAILLVQ